MARLEGAYMNKSGTMLVRVVKYPNGTYRAASNDFELYNYLRNMEYRQTRQEAQQDLGAFAAEAGLISYTGQKFAWEVV